MVLRGSLRLSGTDIYVMICQYYAAGDCAPTACRRAPENKIIKDAISNPNPESQKATERCKEEKKRYYNCIILS